MTAILNHAPIAHDEFERLGPDMITSIDQVGHTSIDAIYHKNTPDGPHHLQGLTSPCTSKPWTEVFGSPTPPCGIPSIRRQWHLAQHPNPRL